MAIMIRCADCGCPLSIVSIGNDIDSTIRVARCDTCFSGLVGNCSATEPVVEETQPEQVAMTEADTIQQSEQAAA